LTSDNSNLQKRIQAMEPLIEKKLAELQTTIDLRRKGEIGAATRMVLQGSGKRSMDQIRALAAELASEENNLLRVRTQRANERMSTSAHTIVAGTLVSILLLLVCFGLLNRELSERKRAQEALRKSEKWFSTTLGSIGDAVIATDMNGAVTFMNSIAQSLTGWSLEEARGKSMEIVFNIVNKETRQPVESPVKKVFREGKVIGLADHTLLLSKDGKEFDIEDSAAPIITNTGKGFGVVLVFRDITEKKSTEEETRHQKELLQLILESLAEGVVVANSNGEFLLFNAAAEQVLGIGATNTVPDLWSEQYGTYLMDGVTSYPPNELPLVRAMRGESVDAVELFIRNAKVPDGRLISVTGRPLRGEDGGLRGGVVVLRDITLQKRSQEAILHAKEDAERTSKFKDQFLSTMSHELRTPLNAVLGFSDLLSEERYGPLNERQQRYVTHIHTGGKHLLRLINDILDLSKIEAGHLQLAIESVPIPTSFSEVLDTLRPLADKKSQTLVRHAAPDLSVRADATRFKQILMNLLGNAIKFTPEGGQIEFAAKQLGEFVRVEVRDSGPGIPLGEQQRIFEAFYRLGQGGKAPEGTGLGLAITQRLVELHGGQLGLESQPGSGSCFYFTLPVAPTVQREKVCKTESGFNARASARILVIEDDLASAQLIESQLALSGYDVVLCDQPRHAVEMAADLRPDAITLDIMMKPVNGWELLSNLRSHPRTATIPVVVVSIIDQPAIGALLGADEYVVKPVKKETLLAAVERCLNHRGHSRQGRPILVVDDDNATREFIAELLSKHGYVVSTAADGAEARAQVAASLPELVILDLILPEVSGFQLLAEWRTDSRTTDLPIFVLTSKDLTLEEKDYLRTNAGALFHKQEQWQEALIRQLQRVVPPVPAGKS
ncbi:MAG TPA: response regulator, partial [Edaphobacter sp.]|uniref:response regulator n=1 Tax=Edaphobacter sp. TaxID=1934404 RepID=UPI002C76B971